MHLLCRISMLYTIFWIIIIDYSCVVLLGLRGVFNRHLFEDCMPSMIDFIINSYPQLCLKISLPLGFVFVAEFYFWIASSFCLNFVIRVERLLELVAEVYVLKRACWSSHIKIQLLSNLCSLLKISYPFLRIITQPLCIIMFRSRFWWVWFLYVRMFGAWSHELMLFQFHFLKHVHSRYKTGIKPIINKGNLRWWHYLLRL